MPRATRSIRLLNRVQVECHEDGVLVKILVKEGQEVDVHTPIAIVCDADKADAVRSMLDKGDDISSKWHRDAAWQAYNSTAGASSGCS